MFGELPLPAKAGSEHASVPRLTALRANAEAGQWSAAHDIAWTSPPRPPRWLPRGAFTRLVSQIYHGESASLRFCGAMAGNFGADDEARELLRLQSLDEGRHLDAYGRYLALLGDIAPPDDATTALFDAALSTASSPVALAVAFQIVLEGEALTIQQDLAATVSCSLLRAINTRSAQDEARHVAFGKTWLPAAIALLSIDERHAIFRWVRKLWVDCADAIRVRYTGVSLVLFRLSRGRMDERWARHRRALVDLGLVTDAESRIL